MALTYGLRSIYQAADANIPHVVGYVTPRTVADDTLFEVWNAETNAGIRAAVDLDGKYYSKAVTAGDILYGVTGGVANVRRLDSLAIGAANRILAVNAGGTAPEWVSGLTLTTGTFATLIVGTGLATPDGTLHVHSGSAGVVTANAIADELVVEGSSSQTGISILGIDAGETFLLFGSPSDNDGGQMRYVPSSGLFQWQAGGALQWQMLSGQLKLTNGSVGLPAWTFINQNTTGMWLGSGNDGLRFSVVGSQVLHLTAAGVGAFSAGVTATTAAFSGAVTITADIANAGHLTLSSADYEIVDIGARGSAANLDRGYLRLWSDGVANVILDSAGGSSFAAALTAASFSGPLTGNVTGNCTGSSGSSPAASLTGSTLAAGVTASSLTSVGTITSGIWNASAIAAGYIGGLPTSQTTSGTFASARISAASVAQHEGSINHNALANYTSARHFTQAEITATGTITTGIWNASAIAAGYIGGLPTSQITSGTFANARIAVGNVTQWNSSITSGACSGNSATATTAAACSGNSVTATTATTTTGNAGSATVLQTARTINGVSFNGSGNITVTAAAGTLSGATLKSTVTASSLTSVGVLNGGSIGTSFGDINNGSSSSIKTLVYQFVGNFTVPTSSVATLFDQSFVGPTVSGGSFQVRTYTGSAMRRCAEFGNGIQVFTLTAPPTGGDKGYGTINVGSNVFRNNSAYANPDAVFEKHYTGKVVKFADSEFADYPGLMPLVECEKFVRQNWHLPRIARGPMGIFTQSEVLLEKVEEAYLYLFSHEHRILALERENESLRAEVRRLAA